MVISRSTRTIRHLVGQIRGHREWEIAYRVYTYSTGEHSASRSDAMHQPVYRADVKYPCQVRRR